MVREIDQPLELGAAMTPTQRAPLEAPLGSEKDKRTVRLATPTRRGVVKEAALNIVAFVDVVNIIVALGEIAAGNKAVGLVQIALGLLAGIPLIKRK